MLPLQHSALPSNITWLDLLTAWYFCYCIWSVLILRNMKWVSKRSECDFVSKWDTKTFRDTKWSRGNCRKLKVASSCRQRSVFFEHHCPLSSLAQKEVKVLIHLLVNRYGHIVNVAQAVAPPTSPSTNTRFWGDALRRTKGWNGISSFSVVGGTCWQGNRGGKYSYAIQATDILCKSKMPSRSQRNSAKKDHYQRLERI